MVKERVSMENSMRGLGGNGGLDYFSSCLAIVF